MSEVVSIIEAARQRPREERLVLLRELLGDFAEQEGLSVIPTPDGRFVWAYLAPSPERRPPELSPDEQVELQQRLDTPNDAVDLDVIIAELRQPGSESDPQ